MPVSTRSSSDGRLVPGSCCYEWSSDASQAFQSAWGQWGLLPEVNAKSQQGPCPRAPTPAVRLCLCLVPHPFT